MPTPKELDLKRAEQVEELLGLVKEIHAFLGLAKKEESEEENEG